MSTELLKNLDGIHITERGAYITTYTRKRFFPLDPQPRDICIEDICMALSNNCRFTGHTSEFYSVLQHSYYVGMYLQNKGYMPAVVLAGLLHDGSEAYIADVSRPVKHLADFGPYRRIEKKIQEVIFKKFGVVEDYKKEVKEADTIMLATEARDLMCDPVWCHDMPKQEAKIVPKASWRVRNDYMDLFYQVYV